MMTMSATKRILMIAFGWAVFHAYMQFTMLITERNFVMPVWFLVEFIIAVLASSLLEKLEESIKTWITSTILSVIIVFVLISSPVVFGVLQTQFVSLIVLGSIQPIMTILMLSSPVNLIGCFLGQVLRNRFV